MMKLYFGLLLLVGAGLADLADDAELYLLPKNIIPTDYNVTVFVNIEQFQNGVERTFVFSGSNEIQIVAIEDNVTQIVLHKYDDVEFQRVQLTSAGSPLGVRVGSYNAVTNKQTLELDVPLNRGNYTLLIDYTGKNTNDLTGFYRSSYLQGLQRRWLLVTDFEPFGARRAFPCFDEPALKARIQLTVNLNQTLVDDGYRAHFNTDVESETIIAGRHITTFKKTPLPISTYLVAFIVADFLSSPEPTYFQSSYKGDNGTKPFYTIGQPKFFSPRQDLVSQVSGPAVLNFMTNKTGVGYGYLKVEQAGIPDFAAGAMENWGLVTYRENLVFWNEASGSLSQKQSVATVTAHELGHQWFGDLVTLHWWTDLWLNEGFATFFEFHATDQIREPTLDTSSWDLIGQFIEDIVEYDALYTDSYSDARPLTSEAYKQSDIDYFFDSISYDKGGSVLRMWLHVLGEDLYYAGLRAYLLERAESIGTPEALLKGWDTAIAALPEADRPNFPSSVSDLFQEWHLQAGYPILQVTRNGANLTITQERFLVDSADTSARWDVPISYSTNLENNFETTTPVAFLLASEQSKTIQLKNGDADWVVLNNQATGYYRINYDDANWDALLDVLDDPSTADQIHEYNRLQIYDDSYNVAFSATKDYQQEPLSRFLRLLKALKHEKSLVVWRAALRGMKHLLNHVDDLEETSVLLKVYLSSIVGPKFEELGLEVAETDSHTDRLLRVDVAEMACRLGLTKCKEQTNKIFKSRLAHPDVRALVLCEGVRQGNDRTWNKMLLEAAKADSLTRQDFMAALACSENDVTLNRLEKLMKADDHFGSLDVLDIITAASKGSRKQMEFGLRLLSSTNVSSKRDMNNILRNLGSGLHDNASVQSSSQQQRQHQQQIFPDPVSATTFAVADVQQLFTHHRRQSQPELPMKSSSRTGVVVVFLALMVLATSSQAKRGCASFGHSCFGGHGKRSEVAPDSVPQSQANLLTLDPLDYQAIQLFRQLCTLQPEQYLRLAPVFRKLAESYAVESEEPLPRK